MAAVPNAHSRKPRDTSCWGQRYGWGVLVSPSPPWGRHRSLSPWARTARAQSWSSGLQARVQLYMSHVSFWVCVVICKMGKGDVRPEVRPAEGIPDSLGPALPRCPDGLSELAGTSCWADHHSASLCPTGMGPPPATAGRHPARSSRHPCPGAVPWTSCDHRIHFWGRTVLMGLGVGQLCGSAGGGRAGARCPRGSTHS